MKNIRIVLILALCAGGSIVTSPLYSVGEHNYISVNGRKNTFGSPAVAIGGSVSSSSQSSFSSSINSLFGEGGRNKAASIGTMVLLGMLLDRLIRKDASWLVKSQNAIGRRVVPGGVRNTWERFKKKVGMPRLGTYLTTLALAGLFSKLITPHHLNRESFSIGSLNYPLHALSGAVSDGYQSFRERMQGLPISTVHTGQEVSLIDDTTQA